MTEHGYPAEPREVRIHFYEEPEDADWNLVCEHLKCLRVNMPLLDLTGIYIVEILPELARDEEQQTEELRMRPIFRSADESGFIMWHFADGSDSEG